MDQSKKKTILNLYQRDKVLNRDFTDDMQRVNRIISCMNKLHEDCTVIHLLVNQLITLFNTFGENSILIIELKMNQEEWPKLYSLCNSIGYNVPDAPRDVLFEETFSSNLIGVPTYEKILRIH